MGKKWNKSIAIHCRKVTTFVLVGEAGSVVETLEEKVRRLIQQDNNFFTVITEKII